MWDLGSLCCNISPAKFLRDQCGVAHPAALTALAPLRYVEARVTAETSSQSSSYRSIPLGGLVKAGDVRLVRRWLAYTDWDPEDI